MHRAAEPCVQAASLRPASPLVVSSSFAFVFVPHLSPRLRACALVLLVGWLAAHPAGAQGLAGAQVPAGAQGPAGAPAAGDGVRRTPYLNLRVYPLALWGPKAGFGAAAGLVAHHVLRDGSVALLTVAPAQYQQVGTLSLATAHPERARRYGVATLRAENTVRRWYHGTGPASDRDDRVAVRKASVEGDLRVGVGLLGRRLVVQPRLGLRYDAVRSAYAVEGGAFERLDGPSRTALDAALGTRPASRDRLTHLVAGLDVTFDVRDRAYLPMRGVLLHARAERWDALEALDLRFWRVVAEAQGVVPLGGRHRLVARALAWRTEPRGNAPVPFYLLPTLDGRLAPGFARDRFVGRDALLGSLTYRFPLAAPLGLVLAEGFVGAYALNAYDDVTEQFAARLSFGADVDAPRAARVPLRPSAAVGLRLGPLFRDNALASVALGVSPEGVTAVRLRATYRLHRLRPRHHF